ncbi:MAG: class I SAM-dependent methyltransferase, partial [Armatimonadetes bacterium]|nr:class I SAM-dependent methyltransferase [Armatimonadota bacterium]
MKKVRRSTFSPRFGNIPAEGAVALLASLTRQGFLQGAPSSCIQFRHQEGGPRVATKGSASCLEAAINGGGTAGTSPTERHDMSAYNLQQIEEFWSTQAAVHGQSASASWSDHSVIEMEIRELAARLSDGQQVLDIGCANGYSSVALASQRNIRVRGLDYIPEMIAQARERLAAHRDALRGEVAFDVGDILALNEPPASYDAVVCVRVIINLADWERQQQGLRNC